MDKVTKKDVRESFTRIRELMRYVDNHLKNTDSIDEVEFQESGFWGQLALELTAESGIFSEFVEYTRQQKANARWSDIRESFTA